MTQFNTQLKLYLASLVLVGLFGCSTDPINDVAIPESKPTLVEMAFPNQIGETKEGIYLNEPIRYQLIYGQAIFQGDMMLSPADLTDPDRSADGTGRSLKSLRWPNRIVYYSIASNLPNQQRVIEAIAHWEAKTAIRFVPRTNQSYYVTFRPGSGCSSNVGRVGGQQFITLGTGCSLGNTIHEIGHTIGLYHEHSRGDRDTYVTVNLANVATGYQDDFKTYLQLGRDGFDMAGGLDFNSIMLYDSYAFSGNGRPTIVRKDGKTFTAQRTGLSAMDIATVQSMYP
ncbi:M12 family metallopeptidase [Fibrella sp. WM1]|uniref:M12 family metallopeptidase n=1 Tax=Fibrella musci TaxID=3242485 RepID=UPI0035203091